MEKLKLTPAHDPFVGGMMHDIGKVALIQSYPGLYPVICEELQRENWNVTMRSVEDLLGAEEDAPDLRVSISSFDENILPEDERDDGGKDDSAMSQDDIDALFE